MSYFQVAGMTALFVRSFVRSKESSFVHRLLVVVVVFLCRCVGVRVVGSSLVLFFVVVVVVVVGWWGRFYLSLEFAEEVVVCCTRRR